MRIKIQTLFLSILPIILFCQDVHSEDNRINILASTYPVYQITRNVVRDAEGVTVALLLPSSLGCPHDYTLTPRDMRKLTKADLLVVNGLGLEEFLGAPLKKANQKIKLIDSSKGIKDLLEFSDEGGDGHSRHCKDHKHHYESINPHLFASPAIVAKLAENIAKGLAEHDSENSEKYRQNAKNYAKKMKKLAEEFEALGKGLKNNRIVAQHGIFDYLARDTGLKIIAVIQVHSGEQPSASTMLRIIKKIKNKKPGVIITQPQYSDKIALTISEETGIPMVKLDPVATGPLDSPLDYYEKIMKKNLEVLKSSLKEKQ